MKPLVPYTMVEVCSSLKPFLVALRLLGVFPFFIDICNLQNITIYSPWQQNNSYTTISARRFSFWKIWSIITIGLGVLFCILIAIIQLKGLYPIQNHPKFSYVSMVTFFTGHTLSLVFIVIMYTSLIWQATRLAELVEKLSYHSTIIGAYQYVCHRDCLMIFFLLITIVFATARACLIGYNPIPHIPLYEELEIIESLIHTMVSLMITLIYNEMVGMVSGIMRTVRDTLSGVELNISGGYFSISNKYNHKYQNGSIIVEESTGNKTGNDIQKQVSSRRISVTNYFMELLSIHKSIQNQFQGPVLILMSHCMFEVISNSYFILMSVGDGGLLDQLEKASHTILGFTFLTVLPIIPSKFETEISDIRKTIVQQQLNCPDENSKNEMQSLQNALDLFPEFSVCGLFTLRRSNIIAILSFIATFIVILMQFEMSAGPPPAISNHTAEG